MYFQYAEGVDWWGTPGLTFSNALEGVLTRFDAGKLMDRGPVNDGVGFIRDYFSRRSVEGRRKRFPALFGIYLSGLDHVAHKEGMGAYRAFFQETTDGALSEFIKALKEQDEFENKIFILVSDHGMTAMPTDLKYTKTETVMDAYGNEYEIEVPTPAETSCELKLDFQIDPVDPNAGKNSRKAELSNNNLHIWELAEVLKRVGENGLGRYKVLAPKEIAELHRKKDRLTKQDIELPYGATRDVKKADIIAGFNGPMAHIYVVDRGKIGQVAELFRLMLQGYHPEEALKWWDMDALDYAQLRESISGRLKSSIDKIFIRRIDGYCVFDGLGTDGKVLCSSTSSTDLENYVRAQERLGGLAEPLRGGDIILAMKDDMTDIVGRFSTGVSCKAWHGSLNRSDSYVPLIYSYPGGNRHELEKVLKEEGICGEDYLGCKWNWSVPKTIQRWISFQYE
jgi:hypothetical protein